MVTNGKTIKQIADELGVSKQAVQKRISKEPLYTSIQQYIVTVVGTKYIEDIGETLIKQAFLSIDRQPVADNQPTTTDTLISMLKNELNEKNSIIKAQQKTIDNLTDTVKSQAQSINADRHNQLAETIQQKLIVDKVTEPTGQELKPQKKGLLSKFFGKG